MARNRHTTITTKQKAARKQNARKATEARKQRTAEARAAAAAMLAKAGVPPMEMSVAKHAVAKAQMAELEAQVRSGRMIPVEQARAQVMQDYATVRTRLLGVPARAKHRLPHLTTTDVDVLDELIREALEELANEDEADLDKA